MTAFRSDSESKIGFRLSNTDVPSARFTPDGKYIIAGGQWKISLLDVFARKSIDRFPVNKPDVTGFVGRLCELVAVSPDGKYVATAGGASVPVRIWDFQTGRLVQSFDTNRACIRALAFSPDGKKVAVGTAYRLHDGPKPYEAVYEIWLWDIERKENMPIRICGHEAPVQSLAFYPDGKRIVSISSVRIMRIWDIATQREVKRSGTWTMPDFYKPFSAGSRFSGRDRQAGSWLGNPRLTVVVSWDGKHVVCGRSVWNAENLELEYFADGLHVWRNFEEWQRINLKPPYVTENKQEKIFEWFAYGYVGTLTPDSRRLVTGGPFGLHWKFSGRGNLTPKGEELFAMKTPNGQSLAIGNESQLSVFDVETGKLLFSDQVFRNGASVFALDVSPDGRYALAAGSGETAGVGGAPVRRDPCQLYVYKLASPLSAPESDQ